MRAAFHVKKELSGDTGSVGLYIYAREVAYETLTSGAACYGKFVNNWNLDKSPEMYPNGPTFVIYKAIFVPPTTSWPGSEFETSSWNTVDGWNGVDVRVRIENGLEFGGSPADIDVDHVRVRHLP